MSQEKSEKFSEYSERTEFLAAEIGIILSDLPDKIGISSSMFHAYRSGKHPISGKAWRKLEAAERAAGIGTGGELAGEERILRGVRADPLPIPRESPAADPFAGLPPEIRAAAQAITTALESSLAAQLLPRLEALESALRRLEKSQAKL